MDVEESTHTYARCLDDEIDRPVSYAEVVRGDDPPADPTCLETTEYRLGTKPIDAGRYYSREFFELENEKLCCQSDANRSPLGRFRLMT